MGKGKVWMMSAGLVALLAISTVAYGSGGEGGHGGSTSAKTSLNSPAMLKAAITGNDEFKGHHDSHYFDAYQTGQAPNLTVISCADSRVHTSLFGLDPNNNIFIIREIGNQVATAEGSVDYGVRHLPTSILMVMGHSGCGAIRAAMGDYSGETPGIKAELDTLKAVIAKDDGSGDFNTRWARNVEVNVDYQVKQALALYADKVQSGQLAVVGAVYDFNDNYGKGRGTLVITNVNGDADPNRIMNHPVLHELSQAQIVNHVSSLAPAVNW
jgi:carbonic anhydrase